MKGEKTISRYHHRDSHRSSGEPRRPSLVPGSDPRLKRAFSRIGTPEERPFTPDPFQLEAVEASLCGDCLVSAPTGSGKTWIAVTSMRKVLESGGRSWYASPLKALSNSKYLEFSRIFGPENVGILTGDRKENADAPIIVGTTEILRNQLYDNMHRGTDISTDFVVMDEAHYISDPDRGVVWEETLIYLPPRIRLLLLSATVGNAGDLAGWLESIRARPMTVVSETRRPVPLVPLLLHPYGTLLPLCPMKGLSACGGLDRRVRDFAKEKRPPRFRNVRGLPPMGEILAVLRQYDLLPAIFFMKSRKDCDAALALCPPVLNEAPERRKVLSQRLASVFQSHPHLAAHRQVNSILKGAVASHHSGQLPAWKLVVECLMEQGLLDAVFATSTVAAGVNFPARTVVFFNSDRYNGSDFLPLSSTEFHQMTGRAGRRGMDRIGFVCAVPGPHMDLADVGALVAAGPGPVFSSLKLDFSMVLNLLLSHSREDVRLVLENSFARYLSDKNEKAGSRDIGAPDPARLFTDFIRRMDFLKLLGYVDAHDRLTADGLWAAKLRVDQPLFIGECFRKSLWPDKDPRILAACVAVFVQEKEMDEGPGADEAPKKLVAAYNKIASGLDPLSKSMTDHLFPVRSLTPWPAAAVHDWACGLTWEQTRENAGLSDGDLAMLILRTAENLRQMSALSSDFPKEAAAARAALALLIRGPLETGELSFEMEE